MKLEKRTVLITGGTSGIGLELAKQLRQRDNTVIVTGRDENKFDAVKQALPGVHIFKSDASDPAAIATLYGEVVSKFPPLDILINNAGIMRQINLHQARSDLEDLTREIDIDLTGPIRMTAQFLPHLKAQKSAAIVNVSSGLAFCPRHNGRSIAPPRPASTHLQSRFAHSSIGPTSGYSNLRPRSP